MWNRNVNQTFHDCASTLHLIVYIAQILIQSMVKAICRSFIIKIDVGFSYYAQGKSIFFSNS